MEFNNHEYSELEVYRRELLNKEGHIEILENNIKELQEQLQNSYKRIEELNDAKKYTPTVVSGIDGDGKPY